MKGEGKCAIPGEIRLLLELLLHFTTNFASGVIDFAHFGEEGGDLVAAEKPSRSSLKQVTEAGLNGSCREKMGRLRSHDINKRGKRDKREQKRGQHEAGMRDY